MSLPTDVFMANSAKAREIVLKMAALQLEYRAAVNQMRAACSMDGEKGLLIELDLLQSATNTSHPLKPLDLAIAAMHDEVYLPEDVAPVITIVLYGLIPDPSRDRMRYGEHFFNERLCNHPAALTYIELIDGVWYLSERGIYLCRMAILAKMEEVHRGR